MSVTGLFLILFVTFHVLMNTVALISPDGYNLICEFWGIGGRSCIGTAILAAGFIVHIIYAFWLTLQNRKARGNDRYAVTSRPKSVEWASQNMLVLGIVVVAFLVVHFAQFWAKMQFVEVAHQLGASTSEDLLFCCRRHAPHRKCLLANVDVACLRNRLGGFMVSHDTRLLELAQSLGASNGKWIPRLRTLGNWWATIVIALFIIQAVVFTCKFA